MQEYAIRTNTQVYTSIATLEAGYAILKKFKPEDNAVLLKLTWNKSLTRAREEVVPPQPRRPRGRPRKNT